MSNSSIATPIIDAFAAGTGGGVFLNIARNDVVAGLRTRVEDPTTLNQSASSLCGPAALLFCLLNDHPDIYAQYIVDLYTTGRGKLGTLIVGPSIACRLYKPGNKIAAVDWIGLASLRDSENSALDYGSVEDTTAGITMPHSLAAWFRAIGYQDVHNKTNVFFTKGRSDIDDCDTLQTHGRWVSLFINDNMLEAHSDQSRSFSPNHWVVLKSGAVVQKDALQISVFTWGDIQQVPLGRPLPVKYFCRNFYGYVSAFDRLK